MTTEMLLGMFVLLGVVSFVAGYIVGSKSKSNNIPTS